MKQDEFEGKLLELTDFAYSRGCSYPDHSAERGIWMRIFTALNQAQREVPE